MEWQQLFNSLMTLFSVLMGWVLKTVWDAMRDLRMEVRELTREVNQDFVRREDFKDAVGEIKIMLNKIFDKLDEKVSKSDM